jgi:hypothetical protein
MNLTLNKSLPLCYLLGTIFISNCSLLSSKNEYDTKKLKPYISGNGFNREDLSEIKKHLSRKVSMGGGIYRIKVYPMTAPLIEAMADDHVAALSLTDMRKEKLKENLFAQYLDKKTCFQFEYEVARIEKSSKLEDWKLEIYDHNKRNFSTQWTEQSLKEIPAKSFTYIGSIKEPVWYGKGVSCSDQNIDLTQDFSIKVVTDFAPFPFSTEADLNWQYPVYKMVEGKEVEVKEESENYKGYRGW